MGLLSKVFLAFLGFILLALGAWFLSIPIFAYLVYAAAQKRSGKGRVIVVTEKEDGEEEGERRWQNGERVSRRRIASHRWKWRYFLGIILLVVALFAGRGGGTLSPLVIGGLGLLCLLWSPLSRSGVATSFAPVGESILVRNRLIPLVWASVNEVKLSSQEAMRVLAALRETLVISTAYSSSPDAIGGEPKIYLVMRILAPTCASAEVRMCRKLRNLVLPLASRGVYLLPLNSDEVEKRFCCRFQSLNLDLDDALDACIGNSPYDTLLVQPEGAYVKAVGAYAREDGEEIPSIGALRDTHRARALTIPPSRQSFERQPLLLEILSCLQERFHFSIPDSCTTFLSNVHVSRSAPLGERLRIRGQNDTGKSDSTVVAESLGSTPIEISRPQLRAIVRMYA